MITVLIAWWPCQSFLFPEYAVDKTLKGIQEFNDKSLKSVETVEKNSLPTKEGLFRNLQALQALLSSFNIR